MKIKLIFKLLFQSRSCSFLIDVSQKKKSARILSLEGKGAEEGLQITSEDQL